MPLLLLGLPLVASVGALAYHSIAQDTSQTVESATPNIALIAAIGIVGLIAYHKLVR